MCLCVIPAEARLKQEGCHDFQATLGYKPRSQVKKKQEEGKKREGREGQDSSQIGFCDHKSSESYIQKVQRTHRNAKERISVGEGPEQTFPQRGHTDGQEAQEEMLSG